MEQTYQPAPPPAWKKPPIADAVATAMGWKHPKTGELLVSVIGLLNDKEEVVVAAVSEDPLTKLEAAVINPDAPIDGAAGGEEKPEGEGEKPADEAGEEKPADEAGEEKPADAAPLFKVKVGATHSIVKLLEPNHHAYTKWEVNGVPIVKRGNETEVPNGATFIARNTKGDFTGNA